MEKGTSSSPGSKSPTADKKVRHRSPNYPAITLGKALERTKQLHDVYRTVPIPERKAHEIWGYRPLGGQGLICTAALKAFGLIQAEGSGEDRKVAVSDAARRILLDAKDRDILLRQAALSPPIHKELWEHYGGFLPERDEDLKKYLLVEKNFNQQSVDGFIAQFRASIALTNLVQGDMLQEDKKEEKIISSNIGENLAMGQSVTLTAVPKDSSGLIRDYIIPRKGQRLAVLRLEFPATKADIDLIKSWLELMAGTLEEQTKEQD
jgi:hypothetical protein